MTPEDAGFADPAARRLLKREGAGTAVNIVQSSDLLLPHLSVDQPGLLLVTAGRKLVSGGGADLVFERGTMALFGGGRAYDVRNEPSPHGPYRAEAVFPAPDLLPAAAPPGTRAVSGIMRIASPSQGLLSALSAAREAIADAALPLGVVRHRVSECLLWLAEHGLAVVAPREVSAAARVRRLVSSDPAGGWSAGRMAQALAMSEATLRRRLAEEGTTLSAVLLDLRMSLALTLLQTTEDSVTAIAAAVGYDSPSRFAARFRERFGFPPGLIRGTDGIDRNGRRLERSGREGEGGIRQTRGP